MACLSCGEELNTAGACSGGVSGRVVILGEIPGSPPVEGLGKGLDFPATCPQCGRPAEGCCLKPVVTVLSLGELEAELTRMNDILEQMAVFMENMSAPIELPDIN